MTNSKTVLLFHTAADPSRATRLHAETCPMVNTGKGRRGVVRAIREDIDATIEDLNERGFPVKHCKCCR